MIEPPPTRTWVIRFAALMATAMASATIVVNSIGLLAAELIAEFDLTRAEVGALATAFGIIAAVTSMPAGGIADRVGGRRTLTGVFFFGGLALLTLAIAPSYWILALALGFGGLANAGANPGTNLLIGAHLPDGRRGLVTGVKMSGVQLAVFAAGIGIPIGVAAIGWRPTVALIAIIPFAGVIWLRIMLPVVPVRPVMRTTAALSPGTLDLAVYTFLMSAAAAATVAYLPLFAEEELGLSAQAAGFTLAIVGIAAVVGRITWGSLIERYNTSGPGLRWVAIGSAIAIAGIVATPIVGTWLVWVLAVSIGFTSSSYNTVATMALLRMTSQEAMGRASGVVFAGFLGGIAAGPVTFGAVVDAVSYSSAWIGAALICVVSLVLAGLRLPDPGSSRGS